MCDWRSNKLIIFQTIIFLFLSLSFILPSGNVSCIDSLCGLRIGSWQLHDSLWHISLSKLGFGAWPLHHPFMAGESLRGYNFLLDWIIYLLAQIGFSQLFSFFKLLPIFIAILYVYSVLKFIKFRTNNSLHQNLLAFFLYFGNSMSYLATLYSSHTVIGATLRGFPVVTTTNPSTMFHNLQYGFSLSLLLWLMMLSKKIPKKIDLLSYFFLFFLLFGFKFYAGIVGIIILLLGSPSLVRVLAASLGSILSYFLFYRGGDALVVPFIWSPFALTHLMIDDPLLFYNHSLTLARYYLYENKVDFSPRLFAIECYSVILFVIINFGTRLFGLLSSIWQRKNLTFCLIIVLTCLFPIFFIQDGGWYNSMQFLYYGVWLAGILTADSLFYLLSHHHNLFTTYLVILIIILTLPTTLEQFRFLTIPQTLISDKELKALDILKSEPVGIVHINDPIRKNGLIPALAEKYPYYLDTDQLMVTHANYQNRLDYLTKFSGGSITEVTAQYFYIYKQEVASPDAVKALSNPYIFTLIYDSDDIAIYRRN